MLTTLFCKCFHYESVVLILDTDISTDYGFIFHYQYQKCQFQYHIIWFYISLPISEMPISISFPRN